jgi:hypothetical protein
MKTHEKLYDTSYPEFFLPRGGMIETNGKGHALFKKQKYYRLAIDFEA